MEFSDLTHFKVGTLHDDAVHSICYAGVWLDLLLKIRRGGPLVVFFNGAVSNRSTMMLPVFGGLGVLAGCPNVSLLCINDPVLYLSDTLPLAWYAGTREMRLQEDLTSLIGSVARRVGASQIVFTGGSGGGFAALYQAVHFPGSVAIVWNPQTDILKYVRTFVDAYLAVAWPEASVTDTGGAMAGRTTWDLCSLYRQTQPEHYVLYMQNAGDWHVRSHMQPFLAALGIAEPRTGKLTSRFFLELGRFGDGHVPPSKEHLQKVYESLLNRPDIRSAWHDGSLAALIGAD